MKTHVIRDSMEARGLIAQGLWFQRVVQPQADGVLHARRHPAERTGDPRQGSQRTGEPGVSGQERQDDGRGQHQRCSGAEIAGIEVRRAHERRRAYSRSRST